MTFPPPYEEVEIYHPGIPDSRHKVPLASLPLREHGGWKRFVEPESTAEDSEEPESDDKKSADPKSVDKPTRSRSGAKKEG